jgi:hypothetical protein
LAGKKFFLSWFSKRKSKQIVNKIDVELLPSSNDDVFADNSGSPYVSFELFDKILRRRWIFIKTVLVLFFLILKERHYLILFNYHRKESRFHVILDSDENLQRSAAS